MSLFEQIAKTANPNNVEYPKGTTKEEWDLYNERVEAHRKFIERYRFFLERIVNHLKFLRPGYQWTPAEIMQAISREIELSESMDAPNKPGYTRANND